MARVPTFRLNSIMEKFFSSQLLSNQLIIHFDVIFSQIALLNRSHPCELRPDESDSFEWKIFILRGINVVWPVSRFHERKKTAENQLLGTSVRNSA